MRTPNVVFLTCNPMASVTSALVMQWALPDQVVVCFVCVFVIFNKPLRQIKVLNMNNVHVYKNPEARLDQIR